MIGHRLRARRANDDGGFALIFTLLVTTIVMLAVATTLTITTPNIVASKNSQDVSAALLAADSGIQDAIAYLTNTPACRSQTRICPQALGADSAKLNRPTLSANQTFHWTTATTATADGYVRVTSTGAEGGVSRTLVADLALNPSILKYGYYSNYESQTPTFLNSYYGPRSIDLTNANTYSQVSSGAGSSSVPQILTWKGAGVSQPSGYSDSVCAQHWYSEGSSSPGRAAAVATQRTLSNNPTQTQTYWAETGTLNSNSVTHYGSCDLVFTAGMTENGLTYSRDAFDIANGNGNGPVFNQPVYTLWGYGNNTNPAAPSQPWRQSDGTGNDLLPNSPNKPQIATQDITLPTSIGTDGVENDSCVYYGPTRVVLNGDGTATVTSPATTSIPSGAALGCYPPNLGASGGPTSVVGFTYNYGTSGSQTIYVKNLNTPSGGVWPQSSITSTTTPAANNEVFYLPPTVAGATTPDQPNTTLAADGCTSSTTFSVTASAPCAWTGVASPTDAGQYTAYAWKSYTATTCGSAADTNRQLFECDYQKLASTATPVVNQAGGAYATLRAAVKADLAKGACVSPPTGTSVLTCLANLVNNDLAPANTTSHRYVVVAGGAGTAATSTQNVGATPSNVESGDSMFTTVPGTPAQETVTRTPYLLAVARQTSTNGGSTWTTGDYQFIVTPTVSSWAISQAASGGQSYFPKTLDVTRYNTGANTSGAAAGSAGTSQPGDLYVEGVNQGSLSLIAQDNVEITGNITKGAGNDTSATNPLSITAGNDIRNFHPVSCVDQTAADINATTAGYCPNDIGGLTTSSTLLNSDGSYTSAHPAAQYTDMPTTSSNTAGIGDRTIDAALFTLTGSLRTDNFDRGVYVGNLNVNGGIYEDYRGANGVTYNNGKYTPGHSGTSLNYTYVDLQRANLQYVPAAYYSTNPRVWNLVSVSAGTNPASTS